MDLKGRFQSKITKIAKQEDNCHFGFQNYPLRDKEKEKEATKRPLRTFHEISSRQTPKVLQSDYC